MFGPIMAVQTPKHVATLSHNQTAVLSEMAVAWNKTHRLPFISSLFIVTQKIITDRLHPRQSQQTEICPKSLISFDIT
jgi:exopolysaccharide biosynthesis predicted pyruvyltransferase EpsI